MHCARYDQCAYLVATARPLLLEMQVGLDFSTLVEGLLASSGWDEITYVWHTNKDPRMQ